MTRTDRIERGLRLNPVIAIDMSGDIARVIVNTDLTHVWPGADCFNVLSATDESKIYTVSLDGSCTCPDHEQRKEICQHSWASVGLECAVAIDRMRKAEHSRECDEIMLVMKSYIDTAPAGIQQTVRDEYDARIWALTMSKVKPIHSNAIQ